MHRGAGEDLDLELLHRREPAHDPLDGGGEDVHPPHDQHVVDAPQDPAFQTRKAPPAWAGRLGQAHPVPAPVAEDRRAGATQVCQHQLPFIGRGPRGRIDDLSDELGLVDVKPELLHTLEAVGPHLRHPRVVETLRPPPFLDPAAYLGDSGAGLARMHGDAHRQLRRIEPALASDFQQMESVRGSTDQHRRSQGLHPRQARGRVLPTPGNHQRSHLARPLEPRPEADEEAEGEGEEDPVLRGDAGAPEDETPAASPPLPRLLRFEPADRRPRCPGGLMDPDVALQRVCEVGPERRVGGLVQDQLRLGGEGQAEEVVPGGEVIRRADARGLPPLRDESVGGKDFARERPKPIPLERAQPLGWRRFQRSVEVGDLYHFSGGHALLLRS